MIGSTKETQLFTVIVTPVVTFFVRYDREDKDAKKNGIQLGPYSFTLQTIIISFYCIGTVVPLAMFVSSLFTSSKPRYTASDYQVREPVTPLVSCGFQGPRFY